MAMFYIVGAKKPQQDGQYLSIYDKARQMVHYLIYCEEVGMFLRLALSGVERLGKDNIISLDINDILPEERCRFGIVSLQGTRLEEQVVSCITAVFAPNKKGGPIGGYPALDWAGEIA